MKPLKPWRSFADQLQQLRERGLQVDNPAAALDYLEHLGYYHLSGYWYPLRAIDPAASAAQGRVVRPARMKLVSVQMKTDAYTVCRGVGHIDAKNRRCDYPGQAKGALTGTRADCRQMVPERVTKKMLALTKLTDGVATT